MQITDPDAFADLLLELLALHPAGLSEYELLQCLRRGTVTTDPFPAASKGQDNYQLFRTHFLLFHHLYRLRERLRQAQQGDLEIHTLCIRKLPYIASNAQMLGQPDPLRAYYLDLANLEQTEPDQVAEMLAGFWARFSRYDRRQQALAALELPDSADNATIQRQYRRLAMRHHPDRGGDPARFQAIHAAMAILNPRGKT